MDEIQSEMKKHLSKIELLEDFVALHLRKDKIAPELRSLDEKTKEVQKCMVKCQQQMKEEQQRLEKEYDEVMGRMMAQQIKIIEYLTELRKKNSEGLRINNHFLTPKASNSNTLGTSRLLKNVLETPKMYLSDYKQSPLVRKVRPNPIPFQFIDFETHITKEAFDTIPKYMRGRETIDDLVSFLETVVIPCFNEKYQLLHRHRDSIRNSCDLELWKVYKEQASYVPGQNFITQGDVSRLLKKTIDKKTLNKFTILRHIGILQEMRKSQTVCYIWIANANAH